MLVLTRKIRERVVLIDPKDNRVIGTVEVVAHIPEGNNSGRFRLGFECNKHDLTILREELYVKRQREEQGTEDGPLN